MAACGEVVLRWHPEMKDYDHVLRGGDGRHTGQQSSIAAEAGRDRRTITRWLDKAREVREAGGKLLGKGKDEKGGRGKPSLASEALQRMDRHRFRQLAAYAKQVMKQLERADKEDKCTRTALLRVVKSTEREARRTENERLAKKTDPLPDGPFQTIVIDPPWSREDDQEKGIAGRGAEGVMETSLQLVDTSKWQITPIGIVFKEDLDYEEWFDLGCRLGKLEGAVQWLIGDWAAAEGRVRNGVRSDAYDLLEEQTGLARQTVQVAKYVSENVDLLIRIKSLQWSHHREVAAMPSTEQQKWLAEAEKNDWTVSELKKQIRRALPAPGDGEWKTG